jgi:ectoine hydroxylase-related dioxygenase (phytanoyl-CoA dioxygenase family)
MLTPSQIEAYRNGGYLVVPDFLSAAEVSGFLSVMDEASAGNTRARFDASRVEMEPDQPPDGTQVRRLYEPCTHYLPFRSFSESEKVVGSAASLLGPDVAFHYSKINMKPPSIGSVVEWHQDLAYYPLTNTDSLALLIYLDDADRQNGCLQVLPGTDDRAFLDHSREGFFQGRVTEPLDESKAVRLEGKAGTAIFLHGLTPHASVANRSDRARRTLILSYRAADAFPLHLAGVTDEAEKHVRLVRGRAHAQARLSRRSIPVPRYRKRLASLYELQRSSRQELQEASSRNAAGPAAGEGA